MIAIIKACGNNIASIQFALDRLNKKSIITNNKTIIRNASHVILPGVGNAKKAMNQLQALGLDEVILRLRQPVLGICLGMQLLYESSEEGNINCLNVIPGKIQKLPSQREYPIPHMGWNQIEFTQKDHSLYSTIIQNKYAYFVHSYIAPLNASTVATTEYSEKFTAIVQHKNFFGMQFHPERSGKTGETLLNNFVEIK